MKNKVLRGIDASPGIAMGKAYVHKKEKLYPKLIKNRTKEEELAVFYKALNDTKIELQEILSKSKEMGKKLSSIIEAQILSLNDPMFIHTIEEKITSGKNVSIAIYDFIQEMKINFENINDHYLKERFFDIQDVAMRVLSKVEGETNNSIKLNEPSIIVAHNLTPTETATLPVKNVLAFATEIGGKNSHTAIIAKALGIPAVVGIKNLLEEIDTGDEVIVDGMRGIVIVNADEDTKRTYEKRKSEYESYEKEMIASSLLPSTTMDGKLYDITANIEFPVEIESAKRNGAKGIGLYRTEFIFFMKNQLPDEETQFNIYKNAVEFFNPNPVIIRTLDIGGDKILKWEYLEEHNPFLGWRGIRFTLDRSEIMLTQFKAILRAGAKGNVKIMLPMVSNIDEVIKAKDLLEEAKKLLKKEGKEFKEDIEMGIMVEVPSVAILGDIFAKNVDFFSIGSNDLTQYTLAVDRGNEKVSYIYDHLDPSVLKLVKMAVDAAHSNGIWVGVCGELASDLLAIPLLVGLKVDEFSVSPSLIPQVKNIVRGITFDESVIITENALCMESSKKVREYLKDELLKRFPNLKNFFMEVER
uniref:Phosphoenolpyruvate-protein phosphotransferase n=1 Tax=candidate division WOR-3 bacterium TaxID=2052148 RepID=A0A7C4YG98_UNCW3